MTKKEQAILWLGSFIKSKEPMILIPKPLIRLMYDVLTQKSITNYDRIINKTPEELAQWIAKFYGCSHCPGFNVPCDNRCAEYWLDWLKQEVE